MSERVTTDRSDHPLRYDAVRDAYGGPPPTAPPPPYLAAPTAPPWQVHPWQGQPWQVQPQGAPAVVAPPDRRPGSVTTAVTLGYVVAAMLLAAAILLFLGAATVAEIADFDGSSQASLSAELVLDGTLNVIVAALLIASSVALGARSVTGRFGYLVAGAIVVIESIYWIARWTSTTGGGLLVYALIFAALTIIGMACSLSRASVSWLQPPG